VRRLTGIAVRVLAVVLCSYLVTWVVLWGWWFLLGAITGATVTATVSRVTGWNRHRHLRDLIDWLGEDLEARRLADLRSEQRIRHMRGQLP
jgi:hypothetical protein